MGKCCCCSTAGLAVVKLLVSSEVPLLADTCLIFAVLFCKPEVGGTPLVLAPVKPCACAAIEVGGRGRCPASIWAVDIDTGV